MKKFLKNNLLAIIVIIFAVGGYVAKTELSMAANDKDIIDLKVIAKQNSETLIEIKSQMNLIVQLYLTLSGDTVNNWKDVPHKPILDGMGNPAINEVWLEMSIDKKYAAFCKYNDSGKVEEKILWDNRGK